MTTTDKNRADALKTIAEFPVTDPANMDALNMRKIAADAIAAPVEQHEAAPADALTDRVESYGRALLAQRTDEAAAILDCIRRGDAVQTEPAMGSMTLAERIAHVGGRITDGGYVEFGSAMAINALIKHVLRDVRVAAQAAPLEGTGNGADGRALYEHLHTLMPEWYPDAWDDLLPKYRDAYATAALSRAPRTEVAGAVAEGWKLVPVEPTVEIVEAICSTSTYGKWPQDFSESAQALRRELATKAWKRALSTIRNASAPAGWRYVLVNDHFAELIEALEYADDKGYLPDAMRASWEGFEYDESAAPQPPSADAAAAPADVTCARMGHGVVSIADCFNPELQEPGLIFMELPEPREIGLDTGDVFPEGARAPADKTLAYVSFANGAAVDQTIAVLQRIKVKHFGAAPADERAAFKAAHKHLDLSEKPDAWDRPMFTHSHVEAAWLGWQARAAASQPAAAAGQEAAVYQILTEEGAWLDVPHKIYERKKSDPALTRVVYTAPPAQVATVPEIDPPEAGGNKGRLPALARTREGHNLYALGYNRGLKKGREKSAQVATRQGLTDERILDEFARKGLNVYDLDGITARPLGRAAVEVVRALLEGDKQ